LKRAGRASCNTHEDHPVTDPTPPQIPALQITHTVDYVWRVAAKWSDGLVQVISDFESEMEANEWIAKNFQEAGPSNKGLKRPGQSAASAMNEALRQRLALARHAWQPVAYAPALR
jgi:hypothetical protein